MESVSRLRTKRRLLAVRRLIYWWAFRIVLLIGNALGTGGVKNRWRDMYLAMRQNGEDQEGEQGVDKVGCL